MRGQAPGTGQTVNLSFLHLLRAGWEMHRFYLHFVGRSRVNFLFIFIKETTGVLKTAENNDWAPLSWEVCYLSLLEHLPGFCLQTRAKRFGMKKQKRGVDPGIHIEGRTLNPVIPLPSVGWVCLSELGLLSGPVSDPTYLKFRSCVPGSRLSPPWQALALPGLWVCKCKELIPAAPRSRSLGRPGHTMGLGSDLGRPLSGDSRGVGRVPPARELHSARGDKV